jgi:hypothetical protein
MTDPIEAAARAIYEDNPVHDYKTNAPLPFEQMQPTAFC